MVLCEIKPHIAQRALEQSMLSILLPQPLKFWDDKHAYLMFPFPLPFLQGFMPSLALNPDPLYRLTHSGVLILSV